MKTINLKFTPMSEYVSTEKLIEKSENLNMIIHYFNSKNVGDNKEKELYVHKKKEILIFLLKEYFNLLLLNENKEKKYLESYCFEIEKFLKDKIKKNDIDIILSKQFPQEMSEKKDLVRSVVLNLNVETNNNQEAIIFQYGEIFINDSSLNKLIRSKVTEEGLKELIQVWIIFQLNRYVGLDNSFISKKIETTKAKEFFKNALNYEIILTEKLANHVSYENFWTAFNKLNKEVGFAKETQRTLLKIFTKEINKNPSQLFTMKDNVFYFNISNAETLLKEPLTKNNKKELTKLYLLHKLFNKIKTPDYLSESMFFISEYAQATKEKLFAQVSKSYVNTTYEDIKRYFDKTNLNSLNEDLGCYAAESMLSQSNAKIVFNVELLRKKIQQQTQSEEDKSQFALIYILNQLLTLPHFTMKHWNNEKEMYQNIELVKTDMEINDELILKSVFGLNNNKLLNSIHTFFKEIELDNVSQEYLHNNLVLKVLKSNVLQTDKNNEKLLIINKNIVLFNEENIDYKKQNLLLKVYVFNKIFKEQKELSWLQDESVNNIQKFMPKILEELKNKVSEKDIYLKIKEIEKDLEIEPNENYKEFNHLSIELDATNDLTFMKNQVLSFKHENKTSLSTVFFKVDIMNKLLNKTIDSYNVKELVKVCLFSKLIEVKEGILRNKSDQLIVLNENFMQLMHNQNSIIEKINGKVLNQEIDTAIIELNEHLPFNPNEDYLKRNVINEVKRLVGIKVKSPFKHLL